MAKEQNQRETKEFEEAPPPYESACNPCGPDPTTYGYDQQGDVTVVVPDQLHMMQKLEPMPNNIAVIIVSAISMLFCCFIGIPALVLAATANHSNNPKTAKSKISKAWGLAIAAIILGIVIPGLIYACEYGIYPGNYDD